MIDSVDRAIISFLNGFAHQSWTFDSCVVLLSRNNLFKGGIVTAILWWAWFGLEKNKEERNKPMLCALLSCFLALFVARALALTLPFRFRPIHTHELQLRLPYDLEPGTAESWSSFPSDHVTLFFSLAMSIFLMSRTMGTVAFAYVVGIISLPRIYLGLHYPTDIVAGALVGMVITYGVYSSQKIGELIHAGAMPLYHKSPGAFYAGCFLLSYEIANLFEEVRATGNYAFQILRAVVSRLGF